MPASPAAPPESAESVAAYRTALVDWYRRSARRLPWRSDPTPYRVWVSELMLQQTRVETVIPYFERFLRRFPDYRSLAEATEEEVMEAWSGLGYYRRARSLHRGAQVILEEHQGEFPRQEEDVLALPGIGPYTAGAIRSIALGQPAPILDGNVIRVLTRVFGIRGDVSRAATRSRLWALAADVVREGEPGEVNQAQMELGALVCHPRAPDCDSCPLAAVCTARRDGLTAELPELPPKRATVDVARCVLLVRREGQVLLRRRLPEEISPGLWDLPGAFPGNDGDVSTGPEEAAAQVPFPVRIGTPRGTLRHAVTFRKITLEVREAVPAEAAGPRVPGAPGRGPDGAELLWSGPEDADERALSSPARRILRRWGAS
ncbi:MAG: A/G-specific adenine glycosylase [Gemmatimonadetes bacterium]|nr:A/G-specific adenine glycosylase [Gemmatimonadota bacterium]